MGGRCQLREIAGGRFLLGEIVWCGLLREIGESQFGKCGTCGRKIAGRGNESLWLGLREIGAWTGRS